NKHIPDNLLIALDHPVKLHPLGRLDKDSEGLLLLTDDGRLFDKVASDKAGKEKEYCVELNKKVNESFLRDMSSGIVIMGKKTRAARIYQVVNNPKAFTIILTQGVNRQIRRMCYKQGYTVLRLIRVRIMHIGLDGMRPGELILLSEKEKRLLKINLA
ncbi:MAG TPA: pseudouridine synthase, partial [Bacteroidia bacterium]|nr:pseudouridine synthase [Bacteroidia bacterium]